MTDFSFSDVSFPVRDDIGVAHERAWGRIGKPGCWWTAAERVAIAAEVRNAAHCPLCRERKAAPSVDAVQGEHQSLGALSDAAIDVIHRVVTEPGRLSKSWFEKSCAAGLSDGQYVELIGVLVTLVSIDSFCRGIGVPLHPLPEPLPGDPSRYRPPAAALEGAWVPMIPAASASGDESDLWTRGRTGNVIRALSLVPDEVRGLKDLSEAHYLSPEQMMDLRRGRTLDREQIELVAGRVSALRECFY